MYIAIEVMVNLIEVMVNLIHEAKNTIDQLLAESSNETECT